jgi:tetratricopeptide (TPR) repeat protein
MKKFVLAILIAVSFTTVAQEKQLISTAIIALDNRNDITEAKKYIDQAAEAIAAKNEAGVDPKQMSKFLFYQGVINFRLASSEDENLRALAPNGGEVAAESFLKLISFEQKIGKERYTQDAIQQIPYVANAIKNLAYNANDAQDFVKAAEYFMSAYDLQANELLGENKVIDTITYYYAGLSYNAGKAYDKAIPILEDVLEMGYNGFTFTAVSVANEQPVRFANKSQMDRQVELGMASNPVVGPTERPNVYKSLLSSFIESGDSASFKTYLLKARADYPSDVSLINLELQGYIDAKDFTKALDILQLAIEQDSTNPIYHYVMGFIYQTNVKDNDKALSAYDKAIALKSDNFDAYFMSGVVWYDQGKATLDEMNQLGMSKAELKKYDALAKIKDDFFRSSLPYFEKAYEINPKDVETVKALWEVYRQLKNREKTMEMKEALDAITAAE